MATAEALERIDAKIANLTTAIAAGGELTALVKGLRDREDQRARLQRQIGAADYAEKST